MGEKCAGRDGGECAETWVSCSVGWVALGEIDFSLPVEVPVLFEKIGLAKRGCPVSGYEGKVVVWSTEQALMGEERHGIAFSGSGIDVRHRRD